MDAIPWGPSISVHPWSKIVFIFSAYFIGVSMIN